MQPTPVNGKHVIFTDNDGNTRDALITHVFNSECVNVVSVNAQGSTEFATSVTQGEGKYRWNWPTVG